MKLFNNKTLLVVLLLLSSYGYVASCKRENDLLPPPASTTPVIARGTAVLTPGNMTVANPLEWKLDKVHSSALWSTSYMVPPVYLFVVLTNLQCTILRMPK